MKNQLFLAAVLTIGTVHPAWSWGTNDWLTLGIKAGSALVGAGVDKLKDSLRDPEAEAAARREEERKLARQFQERVEAIETEQDLTPLQRERLYLVLKTTYANTLAFRRLEALAEERQRQQRDKIFTTSGLLGVVADAALSTPSVAMAQAEAITKSPIHRAEMQAGHAVLMARADHAAQTGQAMSALATPATLPVVPMPDLPPEAEATAGHARMELAGLQAQAAHDAAHLEMPAPPLNAFAPDLGARLWIEFIGSPSETAYLRQQLAALGHTLATTREAADVVYRIEGEYVVTETAQFHGLRRDVGELLEPGSAPIPIPEKKSLGGFKLGLGKLLYNVVRSQGEASSALEPKQQRTFDQKLLLVIARQPQGGRETRLSAMRAQDTDILPGQELAREARDELYTTMGLTLAAR